MRTLGKIAGQARRISEATWEGYSAGYTVDYGEWSGPASARAEQHALNSLAQANGFADYRALLDAIADRTNGRWVHFNMPPASHVPAEARHNDDHSKHF